MILLLVPLSCEDDAIDSTWQLLDTYSAFRAQMLLDYKVNNLWACAVPTV